MSATPPKSASISTAQSRAWSSARAALRSKSSRLQCEKMLNKPVAINIVEVKIPDLNAQLVAENIAAAAGKENFLPPRHEAGHRPRHEASAPRASRPRSPAVWAARKSPAPSSTTRAPSRCRPSRADIDYGFAEAATTYGRIGVKVWLYRGEVLQDSRKPVPAGKEAISNAVAQACKIPQSPQRPFDR